MRGERGEGEHLLASLDISANMLEAVGRDNGVRGEEWGRWGSGSRGEWEGGRGVPLGDNIL